jgi:hypothetical protein
VCISAVDTLSLRSFAQFVDAIDSFSLGEGLSPIAWTTDVVFSVVALLVC